MSSRADQPRRSWPRRRGFAHAVRATGTVTVHLAGQTALDRDGGDRRRAASSGSSSRRSATCSTALRAAGGGPEHLASLTIYIVDIPDYRAHAREIGAVWQRLAGRDYPAMAGIGVARLWDERGAGRARRASAEIPAPVGRAASR